ncbi:MAG: hypothetical protein QGG40_10070, partial [Myxococcota bacterium]|nr:hypothetical protein [Myxococcota bacterium]
GATIEALALRGSGRPSDPLSLPVVRTADDTAWVDWIGDRVLRAVDVDPGHGFAGRAGAALALGRLGEPRLGPVLVRALDDEALDHEGRPGAGLGIQRSVRTVLLYSLGEAGCVEHSRLVASYLSNTHGSASGGFYLPAMLSLWKLGARDALVRATTGDEVTTSNALGVLGALGELSRVEPFLADPRPRVAETARLALHTPVPG